MKNIEQFGRSMVEMLGVLAIIGVLSVGGIAGFQKAMSKYRINKWSSQVHEVILNARILYAQQRSYGEAGDNVWATMKAAGVVPEGFLNKYNIDIYGNRMYMVLSSYIKSNLRLDIGWNLPGGPESVEVCKELYNIANSYSILWYAGVNSGQTEGYCGRGAPIWYNYCRNKLPIDIVKTATWCEAACLKKACHFRILFDNNVQ